MASLLYPPVAFAFSVYIAGDRSQHGGSFNEVSGLDVETEVMTLAEGGENRFSHQLPGRIKHGNLVLKRGIMLLDSPLMTWCQSILEGNLAKRIEAKNINISLLNEGGSPTMVWKVFNTYPVKWSVGKLAAQDNRVALETIEFAFQRIERELQQSPANDGTRNAV